MRPRARTLVSTVAGGLLAAALTGAPAHAEIYWANEQADSIARADGAGTDVDPTFITDATAPRGVAIGGAYVYWAHAGDAASTGNIGRADLDGANPDPDLVTTSGDPGGVSVDNARIYWSQAGFIGRSTLSGASATQNFVALGGAPCAVVSNTDDLYWANGGTPGSIGSSHGASSVVQDFISQTSDPCGVAQAEGLIYWTNRAAGTIGVADRDGTVVDTDLITDTAGGGDLCGVAVAGGRVYWTNRSNDSIGRADLDGGNSNPSFISGADIDGPCGIAVTPTAAATPSSRAFADTPVGAEGEVEAFYIANTSSSVLAYSGAALVGPDADQFQITGNGCVASAAAPGLGCVVNVGFAPTSPGDYAATLRITSAASNSPTDIPISGRALTPPEPPIAGPKAHERDLSIARGADPGRFTGKLTSDEPACAGEQQVILRERKRRRPDPRVGSDRTDDTGRWRVRAPAAEGRVYAIAKHRELAEAVCLAATSRTIRVG